MTILPEVLACLRTESQGDADGHPVIVGVSATHLRDLIAELDARRNQAAEELWDVRNIARGQNWAKNPAPDASAIAPEVHRLRSRFEALREGVDSAAESARHFVANDMCGKEPMRDIIALAGLVDEAAHSPCVA